MSEIFNPHDKILCHISRVKDYFENKNPYPITIEIDPSNACNHSCSFCISGHIHLSKYKNTEFFNRTILNKNVFKRLIEELITTDIKAINWTGGGEPTLNPFLGEAINYIKKNSKIEMGMFSNGSLLEKFNLFDTITNCLTWIRISIDAGSSTTYDNIRKTNKNNNFKVVMNNIKKLIEIKKKNKSKTIIGVGFVITQNNYLEIEDFANHFKNIDIDYCQYKPEIIQIERNSIKSNSGSMQVSADFWVNKVINLLDKAKKILKNKFECNSYKIEDLIVDTKNHGRNYGACIGSQFQPCIGADGNVYVCTNHRGHARYSYGNIFKSSFKKIWSDIKNKEKIMNIINKEEKFSKCTHLCKPHESNKILWTINNNINNKNYFKDLEKKTSFLKKKLKHINFI